MFSGVSLTLWEEGASLTLTTKPSSDCVTLKIISEENALLHQPA